MGQDVYIYYLAQVINDVLLHGLHAWGSVQYPLGKNCGVAKLNACGNFLLSGIVGGRELRITLRHAAPQGVRAAFEADLAQAMQAP